MKHLFKIIFVCFFVSVLSSCSQDDDFAGEDNKPVVNPMEKPVTVVNGTLKFANTSQMFATLDKLQKMNNDELSQWEKSNYNGFSSQKSIFNSIIKSEYDLVESYKNAKTEVEKQRILDKQYSDLYISKRESGFITESVDNEGYSSFDYSVSRKYFTPILNEKGFYAVGDTIFQITPSSEKMWINGNLNNLRILENATVTDSLSNIYVITENPGLRATTTKGSGWQYAGSYRFAINYEYKANSHTTNGNMWKISLAVNFKAQHNGGMWPFKKWSYEMWNLKYYIERQGRVDYIQTFPPYSFISETDPMFRSPESGHSSMRMSDYWIGACPFSNEIKRHDQEWLIYKNRAYNGIASLQPISDVTLEHLEIEGIFEGRITLKWTNGVLKIN